MNEIGFESLLIFFSTKIEFKIFPRTSAKTTNVCSFLNQLRPKLLSAISPFLLILSNLFVRAQVGFLIFSMKYIPLSI